MKVDEGNNRVNINRIILAGLVAGFGMLLTELCIQGILTSLGYTLPQLQNSVADYNVWFSIHMAVTVLSGIPFAVIYAVSANHFGPPLKTALMIGILLGAINLGQATLLPSTFNSAFLDSLISFNTSFLKCLAGALLAGWIYKDNALLLLKRNSPTTI